MKFLLLGAGASIPFFEVPLTTNYITQEITKEERWKLVLKAYWEKFGFHYPISAHKISRDIKLLIARHPNYNFEDIGEVFDKLVLSQWPYNSTPDFKQTFQSFKTLRVIQSFKKSKYDSHFPFLYRCVILSIILDAEKNHSKYYDCLIKKQHSFIKLLSDNQDISDELNSMSIVSLNYDDTLYSSVKELFETGYSIKDLDRSELFLFSEENFIKGQKTISFLHGNIRFYSNGFTPDILKEPDIRIKNIGNIKDKTLIYENESESFSFNTFLTTGKSKDKSLNYNPYAIYYQKMAVDILNSEEIIIVGYSFNDLHINRLLQNFWLKDEFKRLIIVDKVDDCSDIHTIVDIIGGVFNKQANFEDLYEMNRIKTDGFGYLFDKILFYRKGYACFLEEYKSVL